VKLLQINAWQGRISPKLLQFIEREKPDFITTQEIFNGHVMPVPNNEFDLGREIRQASGLTHTWFSPRMSIDVAGKEEPYGNMIFSRWPLSNKQTIETYGKPRWHMMNRDPDRNVSINLQIVTANVDDKQFVLANHHGYIARDAGERFGNATSLRSMKKVAKALQEFENLPIILSGDMNVVSRSDTMRVFRGFLRNLTAEHKIKTTLSALHRFNHPVACDHILVNDGIRVKKFAVRENELVSDHLPLVLEFDL
jgi:endonuclease/exonuclease/phosphatase family metal-dependent hydrolase